MAATTAVVKKIAAVLVVVLPVEVLGEVETEVPAAVVLRVGPRVGLGVRPLHELCACFPNFLIEAQVPFWLFLDLYPECVFFHFLHFPVLGDFDLSFVGFLVLY